MVRAYLVFTGIVIALGFVPIPLTRENWSVGPWWGLLMVTTIGLAPFLPFVAALFRLVASRPVNRLVAGYLATACGSFGIVASFLNALLAGVGSAIALVHGLSLTVAAVAAILSLSFLDERGSSSRKLMLALAVPALVAMWSLFSAGMIVRQADRIAGNQSFCLGTQSPDEVISSFSQLRGLSFYSTTSGYKDTSRWYFHGLMIVDSEHGREVYNWSPRRMAFEHIEHPERLIANPVYVCEPKATFWKTLAVL